MSPTPSPENKTRRWAAPSFAAAGSLALLNLIYWQAGWWHPDTLAGQYIAMAPSTTVMLLGLIGAALLHECKTERALFRQFALAVGAGVLLMSLLFCIQNLFGFQSQLERWMALNTKTMEPHPARHMSPLTAPIFLLASVAYLLEFSPEGARRKTARQVAAILALAILIFSLISLLRYAVQLPLLYSGNFVSMAVLTAVAFMLVSVGLLLTAGADTWPLGVFLPSAAHVPSPQKSTQGLLAVFLLFTAVISATDYLYFKRQQADARHAAQEQLAAIADLKVHQIANWHRERLADAEAIFDSPLHENEIYQFLQNPTNIPARQNLTVWFETLRKHYYYSAVVLYDARGGVCLAVPPVTATTFTHIADCVQRALHTNTVVVEDLHRSQRGQPIHMGVLLPISLQVTATNSPAGVLLFQIDPQQFLYPLVQSWPTPSRSAETQLIRREGNEAVYLNELRHRTNTALTLRRPLYQTNSAAVMAARGQEGVVEGLDYRNVPVLAALRHVPATPWFLVAKVDQEEIYAPLRQQAELVTFLVGLLITAAVLGMGLLWHQRDLTLIRREMQLERQRHESDLRYRTLVENSPYCIHEIDCEGRLLSMNPVGLQMMGAADESAVRSQPYLNAVAAADQKRVSQLLQQALRGQPTTEFEFESADGRIFQSAFIPLRDTTGAIHRLMGLTQDISRRRRAEMEIQHHAEELRRRNQELARFNRVAVDRELRMIKLKMQINNLSRHLGETPPYPLEFLHPKNDPPALHEHN